MACCIKNISTKNYQNRIIGFKVTVKNVGDVFLRHSVVSYVAYKVYHFPEWNKFQKDVCKIAFVYFSLPYFLHCISFIIYLWTCVSEVNWDDDDTDNDNVACCRCVYTVRTKLVGRCESWSNGCTTCCWPVSNTSTSAITLPMTRNAWTPHWAGTSTPEWWRTSSGTNAQLQARAARWRHRLAAISAWWGAIDAGIAGRSLSTLTSIRSHLTTRGTTSWHDIWTTCLMTSARCPTDCFRFGLNSASSKEYVQTYGLELLRVY